MHDFVLVGAGTAGSILASRLTASGRHKVLLVEAGGKPSGPFVAMPAGFAKLFRSKMDWAFQSEPQTSAYNRVIFTPRGKMLGGSSNINAMIHQWCHPADFEGWSAAGAKGWGWNDVAPVFREQENWVGEDQAGAERGRQGPLQVMANVNALPLSHHFVASARQAGCAGSEDGYNGRAYQGAWVCEIAHRSGQRFSAWQAYLKPALERSNLEVVTNAQVVRVELEGGRATGVTVRRGSAETTYRAARGVVLCAGAFGSPQVLWQSGIGPAPALRDLGIAVKVDAREVGANLQDHPLSPVINRSRDAVTLKSAETPGQLLRYFLMRRGMLSSNAVEAMAFAAVPPAVPGDAPNLELLFAPLEWREQGLEQPKIDAFSCGIIPVAPRSRGRLWLKSPDPMAAPAIDFGLFSDEGGIDKAVLLAGLRLFRKIAATGPLANHRSEETFPGNAVADDEEVFARLCSQTQTVYHPTSTCRMGTDAGSVVESGSLRVRGVDGLWVVDASVMPAVPRGHPNAVVSMIANRAANEGWIA